MRKHLLIMLVGLIALLFIFASHEKVDVKPVKNIKKGNIPSTAIVKPDLNFGKFPLYFISNQGQADKKAVFYAKASRYTLWLTKQGLVFDGFKRDKGKENIEYRTRNVEFRRGKNKSRFPQSPKMERDVSRLLFLHANKNPEMVALDETKLRVNYFKGNEGSKWHGNIPTSQAVLYKGLYKNIDLKVYGIEKKIEYDWIIKPGGNPENIRFEYKNVKGTRLDKNGNLLITTEFGELIHKKPVSYQQPAGVVAGGRPAPRGRPVEVTFKKVAENTYGFEVGEYDKNLELIIDPVVLAYSTYLGGNSDWESGYRIAIDGSDNVYVTGYTYSTDFPILNEYQSDQGNYDAFVTKIDTSRSGGASLIYSSYLGGVSPDYGYGIAADDNGIAYIAGYTSSGDFPLLGQYQDYQGGDFDGFITKIDTTRIGTASLIYSTHLGGGGRDYPYGIAIDNNGNVFVAGYTDSSDFPILNQYQADQPDFDAFVTEIDTTRSGSAGLIYSTYLGGGGRDLGYAIARDANGFIYVTGETQSTDFPTLNQYQGYQQNGDSFITKIDPTQAGEASLIYSTYLGGEDNDYGLGIAADDKGGAYVTGDTYSTNFPTVSPIQSTWGGIRDAFVARIDTTQDGTSSLTYATYLGGDQSERGCGITVDAYGNALVTGNTYSGNFPTMQEYQTYQGNADVFVTKIDLTQSGITGLIYSTYLGGEGRDWGFGIAVDNSGNAYITGGTLSNNFPLLNQFQTDQYEEDAFVTKLTADLPLTVSTAVISSITNTSAVSGGNVTADGGAEVTLRGVCWNTSPNPTILDNYTTNGCGMGIFTSSITGLIPDTTYYLRAYAITSQGNAYGNERTFTTPISTITVTSPNGEETWYVGTQHDITWSTTGMVGNVEIEYSTNNGNNWTSIVSSTANDGIYGWTIPDVFSSNCLIRISETDGDPTDSSDDVFSMMPAPGITVTSPNGGETWMVGLTQNITWTSTGIVGNVTIEYSGDNGENWTEIIASTANDQSHPWTIPNDLSNQCLIRVSETDGSPSDTSDDMFSIVPIPAITVTSPNGGETWTADSVYNITWTTTGTVGNVKIEYSTNNGGNWSTVATSTENDGIYPWTTPGITSSQCLIRISETDGSPSDTSDNSYSIIMSSLNVTSPNGGENWPAGSTNTITWTSQGTVGNVIIEYSSDTGGSWETIVPATENDGSFNWTIQAEPSSNCLVRISETDKDSGPADVSDAVFSIVSPVSGSLTLRSPNGGESWLAGSSQEIKWNSTGDINFVTIKYSTDNGTTWDTIVNATANNGSFDWTVPSLVSDECLVRVTANDSDIDPKPSDVSDGVFSILPLSSPTIRVDAPNGGEQLTAGSSFDITWYAANSRGDVQIEYSADGGNTWREITGAVENSGKYEWTVPDEPSVTCLVRISETDGDPVDISDNVFSIIQPSPGDITVTDPNGGEQWTAGSSKEITWTAGGDINNVQIEYSRDNGITWETILQTAPNEGSFEWTVPDIASDECLVRITSNDESSDPRQSDISDAVFSIVPISSPFIRVTAPNGSEELVIGSRTSITWNTVNTRENVKIEYSVNGGQTWTIIAETTANTGDFEWTVPDNPSESCLVRVGESDGEPLDISDSVFSIIQRFSNDLTIAAPNGGETWTVGSLQEITWTSNGDINNVMIEYSTDTGVTWREIVQNTADDSSFDWTIPDTVSDECLVRVTANDDDLDPKPSDLSDQVFAIVPQVPDDFRVISPNGGETWEVGSTQQIAWNSTANLENVAIAYSIDNGGSWITIDESPANTGTYNWEIPDTPSEACLVRISATITGSDDDVFDTSDDVFSIAPAQVPTTITVLTPNGGETLYIGNSYDITWATTGNREDVTIEYSTTGGNGWAEIAAGIPNTGSYEWMVPDEPSESCLIRVSETNGTELDISDAVFTICPLPAVPVEVLAPNGGETLEADSSYNITWDSNGIDNVIIEYSINNGLSWSFIVAVPAAGGTYSWTVPQTGSDTCLVRISGNDGEENPSDTSDAVFSITQPPQASVEVITPNGGENMAVGAEYNITWTSTDIREVQIEYSTNNGESWIEIDTVNALGGRYTWTVPDTPSTQCRVRLNGNGASDVSDAVFSIVADSP